MRTTRRQLEAQLERLAEACGHPAGYVDDGWFLSNNPTYGGYVVCERIAGTTGESRPFGDLRRPPREMAECLRFALSALYERDEQRAITAARARA